jgi:hypothetical protein
MIEPGNQPLSETSLERRKIFAEIHRTRAWGDGESTSGPGSTRERAASFLHELIELVQSLGVSTLLDAPCGDFSWAKPLADSVSVYIGVDVVPALVADCNQRFSSPRRRFLCLDFVENTLPHADLVLCRDGLVHLSESDIIRALRNLRATGAEYFIATTFTGDRENIDVPTGGWRPLNLERSPFWLPQPLRLVDERCYHTGGIYADKRLALWRFRDLGGSKR